jgi:hypothetical protein
VISKSFLVVALLLSLVLLPIYAVASHVSHRARAFYTETLYVNSASYPLATAGTSNLGAVTLDPMQYVGYIAEIVLVIVIIAIIIYAFSRRRKTLPKHPSQQQRPLPGPPPKDIDLTPKQPPVQQIVIKEVVKVKCLYCGALIDSTAQVCPICGAPRT